MRRAALALPLLLVLSSTVADGETLDVSMKTGGMFGSITSADSRKEGAQPIGGAVIGLVFNRDVSYGISTAIAPQFVIDAESQEVIRKGVDAVVTYHVLGGSRRVVENLQLGMVESRSRFNLSLLGRSGYFAYTATDESGREAPIEGATIESGGGLEVRMDLTEASALGMNVIANFLTFAASSERVKTSLVEFGFLLRLYL